MEILDLALKDHDPGAEALVRLTGASNVTGELWPVRRMTDVAHRRGARVVLDAAQLVPHRPVSVQDLGVDWVAFSGHKLYAPFGAGVLAGRSALARAGVPDPAGGALPSR
ncbi:Aminotransferase OS=Streptomyces microflavus OX=1919 GN=Smic_21710 PE=4 SV=1 [Streptomyces microflavus]